ncbi:amidase [Variovorax sp. YR752]|uniref:amidase n=1 Tax=Variovorax sp. YR752 TaxID=1884383 RepID=UPI003137E63A
MVDDLCAIRARIASGAVTARSAMESSVAAARSDTCRHTFLSTSFDSALAQADAASRDTPLVGLAVSIKDLFDVAGEPTKAASAAMSAAPPARADCPAVARLRAAGAAFIGRTNMSEFAFSGVGINPHHGTPANVATASLDPTPRIPGGSTSGGAVSVAAGAAWAALGSDTGGSIRIPAALQGLVGFKSTARLVPTDGAIPLSTTLDTVCAITRSVRDAIVLHEVLAQRRVALPAKPLPALRLGVPTTLMLDALEPPVAAAFDRALAVLRDAGATIEQIALPTLAELAGLNAAGGFSAAESWAWHRRRLTTDAERYDPRVAMRIRRGEKMSAADYVELMWARRDWIARTEAAIARFDAMLSPTVPIVAPPIAPLVASDDAFFAANGLLLRNPSAINFLDGCALSLPCQRDGEMPVGLMVWSAALRDDAVLDASLAIEAAIQAATAPQRR